MPTATETVDEVKPWEEFQAPKPWEEFQQSQPEPKPWEEFQTQAESPSLGLTPADFAVPKSTEQRLSQERVALAKIGMTPDQGIDSGFDNPLLNIQQPNIPGFAAHHPALAGASEAIVPAINSLTTPRNLAYMAASMGVGSTGVAGKALVGAFWSAFMGANAVKDAPRIASELGAEMVKPEDQRDPQKISRLLTEAGIDTAMAVAPAVGTSLELHEITGAKPTANARIETVIAPTAPATAEALKQTLADFKTGETPITPEVPSAVPIEKSATEVLRNEQPEMGLQEVGTRNAQPEVAPEPEVRPPEKPPETPVGTERIAEPQPAEVVGMGGATPSEFSKQQANPDVYGVAAEVREQRANAGQVEPVEPGIGIAAPDSVEAGRRLIDAGGDPVKSMESFEATKKLGHDDMAIARAYGETLAAQARVSEEKFGTDSPEYKKAFDELSAWDKRSKVMQTEWHKTGMAQQGMTDIDTGSFTGLRRAFEQDSGKPMPEAKEPKAKRIAKRINEAGVEAQQAKEKLFKNVQETRSLSDAEKAAWEAVWKQHRDAAVRVADAENKARLANIDRDNAVKAVQEANAKRVRDLTDQTIQKSAKKLADAENKARVAEAVAKKKLADVAAKRAEADAKRANAFKTKAAIAAVRAENKLRVLKADLPSYVWTKAREYIDKGESNFDDIRNKIATDEGLPVNKVTAALGKDKTAKYLTDELWRKQQVLRRLDQAAKRWLKETQYPWFRKALEFAPKFMFGAKVFGHGTVALGTHAPMVAFQPRFWKIYAQNFVKMYRMVASPAFYESQVQDLLRNPNYTRARRAGLVNDPYQYEDYNSPDIMKYFGPLTTMGNRGYSILKMLRQDMFDQYWNKFPKTMRIDEVAAAIADGVNHATGVVKVSAPKGTAIALFAPRLEMSRAAWLVADPAKMASAFLNWKNASDGQKVFAINQIKEKAWVAGTMMGLLAANQGILSLVGSKQKINFDDPMHSDWLKFKAGGMNMAYGNAMISMARLPVRLYQIRSSDGGKLKNVIYPDESSYSVLGEFARSQESPFASLVTTLWLKGDWQNRPLPNSTRPVPKRLRAQGIKPYTWPEFWSEQLLPIPAEEAVREVWRTGMGMSPKQVEQMRKALATISIMTATGARVTEDIPYKK